MLVIVKEKHIFHRESNFHRIPCFFGGFFYSLTTIWMNSTVGSVQLLKSPIPRILWGRPGVSCHFHSSHGRTPSWRKCSFDICAVKNISRWSKRIQSHSAGCSKNDLQTVTFQWDTKPISLSFWKIAISLSCLNNSYLRFSDFSLDSVQTIHTGRKVQLSRDQCSQKCPRQMAAHHWLPLINSRLWAGFIHTQRLLLL